MKRFFVVFFCLLSVQLFYAQIRQLDSGMANFNGGGLNQNLDSISDTEINVKLSGKTKYTDYKIISFKNDTTIVDTTLTIQKHYKFNFLRKDNFELLGFHNQGQTFTNLGYNFTDISSFPDIGFRAKQFNFFEKEDVNYYHVPTPTTEAMYKTGLQQGQVLDILFTSNFSKRFNVGVAYKGLRSLGAYRRSLVSSGNFRVSFSYESPKQQYAMRGHAVNQDILNQENGGLTDDSLAAFFNDDPNFSKDRGRLDTKLIDAQNKLDAKDNEDKGKRGENNFLRHLTYVGAKKRYGEITESIRERLDFELEVIEKTGYPGYFLIVEDFIREARKMDVAVGPGRGSAAGSVVAYCLWITNIDPIKYDLLFERFLNPERVSMPDIDIDFDDEGRGRVMDYVIDKYGANQVAQIITYGTMAAKSSIRDTARVLDLPLFEADRIAKLIPGMKLKKIFSLDDKQLSEKLRAEEIELVNELKRLSNGSDLMAETINKARILEGSVRNTGIHACGVIITPDDITKFVPVALAKDSDMYVTQFDNSVVEDAGLLKMDFLGLKTLTLIKDTVKIVKARHDVLLDPETFPLDDVKTYELFQRGETVGIFQYESPGMQKHMRSLKPTVFEDLIAMNALYRPGPMEYIPSFIRRKHGDEEIEYDLPAMEEYLSETYGITVYQEQVMLLSQKLADFTKGEADVLRKAMGKKQIAVLDKMKPKFVKQAIANGHDEKKLEKIWTDWEAFASYAFNKSHSTCYAWIAYQTAYLKAHYPAEYMAAVLSNNMNDIKSVSFFMEECKRAGITVLGPDVNESFSKFSVNKEGAIRFGMAAIKGVGALAVKAIITEREKNGGFNSVFDVAKRVDLRVANKKAFEGLILAGGFDSFKNTHRAQYFIEDEKNQKFIEKVLRFGNKYQENLNSAQVSLFGGASEEEMPEPIIPICDTWGTMELLGKEKEVVGIYISAHPLDDFKNELSFCNAKLSYYNDLPKYEGMALTFGGIVTDVQHRISKAGKGWATFFIEDYSENFEFRIFGEEYLKFKHFLVPNSFLFVKTMVKPGWTNREGIKGDPRVGFTEFILLHDIMDKMCKKITIKMHLKEVNENRIKNLQHLFTTNKGAQNLHFTIWDTEEKIELNMPSRNTKIKVTNEFLSSLENQHIKYKLN